jgi:hypothetical protein
MLPHAWRESDRADVRATVAGVTRKIAFIVGSGQREEARVAEARGFPALLRVALRAVAVRYNGCGWPGNYGAKDRLNYSSCPAGKAYGPDYAGKLGQEGALRVLKG